MVDHCNMLHIIKFMSHLLVDVKADDALYSLCSLCGHNQPFMATLSSQIIPRMFHVHSSASCSEGHPLQLLLVHRK